MSERLQWILKGAGSTMEIYPPGEVTIEVTDPKERLLRSWKRTGQAIQRSIERFELEQSA